MKTRIGFISNSSSTSYLIAFQNENQPCPTCGYCPPNIIDVITEDYLSDDSSVLNQNIDTINEQKSIIDDINKELQVFQNRDPNSLAYPNNTWGSTTKCCELIPYLNQQLIHAQRTLKLLQQYHKDGYTIAHISIDNYNTYLNQLINNKTIILIEEEN